MAETDQDVPPWLKSRRDGDRTYWRWECVRCGSSGLENSAREGAVQGYVSHVRKSHEGEKPPSRA